MLNESGGSNWSTPAGGVNPNAPYFLGGFVGFVSAQFGYVARTLEDLGDGAASLAVRSYGAGLAAAPDIIGAAQDLASGNISGVTVDLGKALGAATAGEIGGVVGGILTGGDPLGVALGTAAGAIGGDLFGGYAGNAVNGFYAGSGFEANLGNMTGAIGGNYANAFNSSGYGFSGSFTDAGGSKMEYSI